MFTRIGTDGSRNQYMYKVDWKIEMHSTENRPRFADPVVGPLKLGDGCGSTLH